MFAHVFRQYIDLFNFWKLAELPWISRCGVKAGKEDSNSHVLCKTWVMVISRRRFAENGKEMYGNKKKAREGLSKLLFLVIKYAKFVVVSLPWRRRRRTCLWVNRKLYNENEVINTKYKQALHLFVTRRNFFFKSFSVSTEHWRSKNWPGVRGFKNMKWQ